MAINIREKLRNLTKAVKKEREIDTRAVERSREYIRRVKQATKTR
ncbi:unnamed protein product [marine sediment metagenome]|uniref:Uncharacterized protein n=1 Tax=marine sediment metagenome TaxID=412755 RepID=X1HKY7_9ZZZZ